MTRPDQYMLKRVWVANLRPEVAYILATDQAFYSFGCNAWNPLSSLKKYMGPDFLLYVATSPLPTSERQLLCKIGFADKLRDPDELINYLEKKSPLLRLANQPGALIFTMPIPSVLYSFQNHTRLLRTD